MNSSEEQRIAEAASAGVREYLEERLAAGALARNFFDEAVRNVEQNLNEWLLSPDIDRLSPRLKQGVVEAVEEERWEELTNAFVRQAKFGTGGIRALMAFRKEDIQELAAEGLDAQILKGPNTLNNVVVAQCAWGVARYFADRHGNEGHPWAVVGFDSRIQGEEFAQWVASIFLSEGLGVYLFDEAVPYPEVTFAIPTLDADVGVFISASHNDYRYNGFKLSGANGSQVSPTDRDTILNEYIRVAEFADIHPVALDSLGETTAERLVFLGGSSPREGHEYFGRQDSIRDMHSLHAEQVKQFLVDADVKDKAKELRVVYSAFNGAGRRLVPRLLGELGFEHVYRIRALDELNGFFPAFKSEPGEEQQPDPGDPRAAAIALRELRKEVEDPEVDVSIPWSEADLLLGTDPDADRCGVVVKPTPELATAIEERSELSRFRYSAEHVLLPADDVWTLLLWYRATRGALPSADGSFVALSHTTTDAIVRLAKAHGIGVIKTWVGFGWLAAGVAEVWKHGALPVIRQGRPAGRRDASSCHQIFYDTSDLGEGRRYNAAALEQSNGFSILGAPPEDFPTPDRSLGVGGHVRDKDGTFASILAAELAAETKQSGSDLLQLLAEEVFLNPDVGIYANYYEPDPIDGEYPGIEGDSKKRGILEKVLHMAEQVQSGGTVALAGHLVSESWVYRTGKYDEVNWPGFPDEGIRFYFGSDQDYLTVRPSGTSNALRFHVQLHWAEDEPRDVLDAWRKRLELEVRANQIVNDLRERVDAPRLAGAEI